MAFIKKKFLLLKIFEKVEKTGIISTKFSFRCTPSVILGSSPYLNQNSLCAFNNNFLDLALYNSQKLSAWMFFHEDQSDKSQNPIQKKCLLIGGNSHMTSIKSCMQGGPMVWKSGGRSGGLSTNMVGIICTLIDIGITDLQKSAPLSMLLFGRWCGGGFLQPKNLVTLAQNRNESTITFELKLNSCQAGNCHKWLAWI